METREPAENNRPQTTALSAYIFGWDSIHIKNDEAICLYSSQDQCPDTLVADKLDLHGSDISSVTWERSRV